MDYAIKCANIIYYHHMLVFLGCCRLVAGILLWVKCSMVYFIKRLDEVGFLSCLVSILVYISYLRLELISAFISVYCGLPLAIERFSS
jgi:hypothetical protein